MIKYFFKLSIRNIVNHPTYSIINIGGLCVGLACFIVIMLWVNYETSYDKFHNNSDRLYRVACTDTRGEFHGYYQTGKLASYLKENFPEIAHSTSFNAGQCKVAYNTKGFYCMASFADSSFFKMFTYHFISGDATTSLRQPNTVVITLSLAKRLFGGEAPIGKMVKINEETSFMVTGVINDVPHNSHMQFDLLMPFYNTKSWMKTWDSKWTNTYVMLQSNNQFEDVNKKISGIMNLFQPGWGNILYLFPVTKSHTHDLKGGGLIVYIWIFSFMAIIVLLLACVNFMNLATSCSSVRQKEIFIKKVSGSKRIQVSLQFLFETLILSLISLAAAVIMVKMSLPLINNLLRTNLNLVFSASIIFILISTTIIVGIISGSYPAFYMARIIPTQIFQKSYPKRSFKLNFKQTLVVFQFIVSIFFICCTLLVVTQVNYLQTKDLGINKHNIIKLSTIGKLSEKAADLKKELLKSPSIENVTVSNTDLTSWNNSGPLEWKGKNVNEVNEIGYNWVDNDFLKTFKLEMKEGRFFSQEYASDLGSSFILNEKAVSYLKLQNPIGMKVKSWFGVEGTIIGVIKDFHTASLHEGLGPIALLATDKANHMFIEVKGVNLPSTLKLINTKVKEFVPDDPFNYQFLDEHIDNLYRTETLTEKIAIAITILAIFISCLGLLGLTLSTLERHTKEIGIRKVNGARTSEIIAMLNRDFIKWVVIAFLLACPIAWYAMHNWLENFAYKTELSWWIFAAAGVIALFIALLTVSWQSWRAATRNPVESLRYE